MAISDALPLEAAHPAVVFIINREAPIARLPNFSTIELYTTRLLSVDDVVRVCFYN